MSDHLAWTFIFLWKNVSNVTNFLKLLSSAKYKGPGRQISCAGRYSSKMFQKFPNKSPPPGQLGECSRFTITHTRFWDGGQWLFSHQSLGGGQGIFYTGDLGMGVKKRHFCSGELGVQTFFSGKIEIFDTK